MDLCPCGSNKTYAECCKPVIIGDSPALTAERLMRSRYSAYVKKEIGYLLTSLHPDHRSDYDEKGAIDWAESSDWLAFRILNTEKGGQEDQEGKVEFIVIFAQNRMKLEHHEISSFKKEGETWYFTEGKTIQPQPIIRANPKIGRNDPCACGSGKKFKKCCGQ